MRLDAKSHTIWFNRGTCSILTLEGRNRFEFTAPEFYTQFLDWGHTSADLVIRKGKVYLHVIMKTKIDDPVPNGGIVGIDAGIKKSAVTSRNWFFGGSILSYAAREGCRKPAPDAPLTIGVEQARPSLATG